ncbi:MAG: PadR family transcriptional regulator [Sphingobium sp.]|nr:PadR family transcriptional regulator [Sphingobium sp.]
MSNGPKDWEGFEGFPGWEHIRAQFGGRGRGFGRGGPGGPGGPGGGKGGWDNFGDAISGFVNEAINGAMRGGFGGPGGPKGRMFDGGELRLVLLKLIEDGPRHGYDLIRAVEEMTGGVYAPSPGIVYPTLTMLADMELIAEQESEGARKVFEITEAGREHLAEREEEVDGLMARLNGVGAMRHRASRGPVRRATQNLKAAIHSRMGAGGDENGELSHQIADILDEAARKIERLP